MSDLSTQKLIDVTDVGTSFTETSRTVDLHQMNQRNYSVQSSTTASAAAAIVFSWSDISYKTISEAAHLLVTGMKIALTTGGTLPPSLSAKDYYAIKVAAGTFQLADTYADALAGTAVEIGGNGTCSVAPTAVVQTFTDAAIAGDVITIAAHGYQTGTRVAATTDNTLPGGLAAGDYFIIRVSATEISLAATNVLALAGTALSLAPAGAGNHTLTPYSAVRTFVDADITFKTIGDIAHGLNTGEEIMFSSSGSHTPGGVVPGVGYVIRTGADTYELAASHADAVAGTGINFGGTGNHTLTPAAYASTVAIQESNDATKWITIHTETFTGTANQLYAATVSGRYLQVVATVTGGGGNITVTGDFV